jgi:hypothetical protein
MSLSNDAIHTLADSVADRIKRTGEGFLESFGYEFRHSSSYDAEILHQTRISVGIILRARKEKHPHKSQIIPTQESLFVTAPLPQYPD